jgi:hypothetical protein
MRGAWGAKWARVDEFAVLLQAHQPSQHCTTHEDPAHGMLTATQCSCAGQKQKDLNDRIVLVSVAQRSQWANEHS